MSSGLTLDWEQERSLIQTARLRLLIERRALASDPTIATTPEISRRPSTSPGVVRSMSTNDVDRLASAPLTAPLPRS